MPLRSIVAPLDLPVTVQPIAVSMLASGIILLVIEHNDVQPAVFLLALLGCCPAIPFPPVPAQVVDLHLGKDNRYTQPETRIVTDLYGQRDDIQIQTPTRPIR